MGSYVLSESRTDILLLFWWILSQNNVEPLMLHDDDYLSWWFSIAFQTYASLSKCLCTGNYPFFLWHVQNVFSKNNNMYQTHCGLRKKKDHIGCSIVWTPTASLGVFVNRQDNNLEQSGSCKKKKLIFLRMRFRSSVNFDIKNFLRLGNDPNSILYYHELYNCFSNKQLLII